jgi:hypothetical protein
MSDVYTPTTKALIKAKPVVPNDVSDLSPCARGLYIGVSGDLVVLMGGDSDGVSVTFKNVASGTLMPIVVRRVLATGTTATNIIAAY